MPAPVLPPELDNELFGAEPCQRREPDRVRWVWVVYLILFAISVPWYLPADMTPPVVFGLPYWVVISLAAAAAAAGFTFIVVDRCWTPDRRWPRTDRHEADRR